MSERREQYRPQQWHALKPDQNHLARRGTGPSTDNLIILSRDDLLRRAQRDIPDLGTPEGRDFISKIIEQYGPELTFLDSLSTLVLSGVENDAEPWAPIQQWMMQHRMRERAMVMVHHEGRSGNARGTSKREDPLDSIVRLQERENNDPDETAFDLSFPKHRDFWGKDCAPMTIRLKMRDGTAEWTTEAWKDERAEKIGKLAKDGMAQKEIAQTLGTSQLPSRAP